MHSSVQLFPALPEGVQGTFGRGLLDSPRPARRPPGGGAGPLRKRGIFLNTTANYQLSQWEGADRILMEDFNNDNQKIDAALKATADAVETEAEARAAADADVAARLPAVKLRELTVSAAANTVSLDVSGLDFAAYDGVRFVVESETGVNDGVYLQFNGQTSGYESASPGFSSGDGDVGVPVSSYGSFRTVIDLGAWGDWMTFSCSGWTFANEHFSGIWTRGVHKALDHTQLTSANLICSPFEGNVPAGTKVTIYGLRN